MSRTHAARCALRAVVSVCCARRTAELERAAHRIDYVPRYVRERFDRNGDCISQEYAGHAAVVSRGITRAKGAPGFETLGANISKPIQYGRKRVR